MRQALTEQEQRTQEIASTIMLQLGGHLNIMIGAKYFVCGHDETGTWLRFRFPGKGMNRCKITLTAWDLYDVEIGYSRMSKGIPTYKVKNQESGLYADNLIPWFERTTGLFLTLARK